MVQQTSFAGAIEPDPNGVSDQIIERYLQATGTEATGQRGASMEVEINASVPKLQANGRLRALRVISRLGRISYRVIAFQGSNTVKSQIIARFLQADQQSQANLRVAVNPANYHFHLKGRRNAEGKDVYVFGLVPKSRVVGLFRGEMWLDARTYLPVLERGRLVKNPSIFFKKVDFERSFAIQDGRAVPQSMNSVISTRVVGKVELDINYSHFSELMNDAEPAVTSMGRSDYQSK